MTGFKAVRSFKHGRLYLAGEDVNINEYVNKDLEKRGLIRWVERPEIIKPIKTNIVKTKTTKPKAKKHGSKSKK